MIVHAIRVNETYFALFFPMITISIIIPIYNVELYVKQCLESVMAQNIVEVDVECILVDDCGQDKSMTIVRQMVENYEGPILFHILHHEHNRGLSAARNTGLDVATGDYVLFIDSDDYLMPDALKSMLGGLHLYPEADVVVGNTMNEADGRTTFPPFASSKCIDNHYVFFTEILRLQINIQAWNKLIRRNVMVESGLRFVEGILYEDQLWSFLLFDSVSSVLLLPDVTYFYRSNENSIVNISHSQPKANHVAMSYTRSVMEMLHRPPTVEKYDRNVCVNYLVFMTNCMMKAVDFSVSYKVSAETMREMKRTRRLLMLRTLRYGRLFVAVFMLLLFSPFCLLQQWAFFRHNYHRLEVLVLNVAHFTDFFHRKDII